MRKPSVILSRSMPYTGKDDAMARYRHHGEGTIYWHKASQQWAAQATVEGGKRKTIYGKTAGEVREKLTALTRDRDKGLPVAEGQQTVRAYLTDWLRSIQPPAVRESTWIRYESAVRVHIIPALGRHRLGKLLPAHVQAFYAAKLDSDLSATSVRRLHDVLHNALAEAERQGLIARNPTNVIRRPREAERHMQVYSLAEVNQLREAMRGGDRLENLYLLALNTGMRQGELLALRWRDVDLTCGDVFVQRGRSRTAHGYADKGPKRESARRRIPLTASAVAALKDQRARVLAARLRAGERWREHDLVFPSEVGTHLYGANVRRAWRALVDRANLPYIRLHDLRHTAATLLLQEDVPLATVALILGHANVATTGKFYAHVNRAMERRAVEAMERLMGSRTAERGEERKKGTGDA